MSQWSHSRTEDGLTVNQNAGDLNRTRIGSIEDQGPERRTGGNPMREGLGIDQLPECPLFPRLQGHSTNPVELVLQDSPERSGWLGEFDRSRIPLEKFSDLSRAESHQDPCSR